MLKIALLFLTISNVYHIDYWKDFLKGHDNQFSIYVHSKETIPADSYFKQYEIKPKVPTQWEHVMKAQIALLSEALKDANNQKFIFLTESTIPLQDFDTVYKTVMASTKSMFPYCQNPHQDSYRVGTFWGYHNYQPHQILYGIPSHLQYKNHPWIILNRKHAELMVNDNKYLPIITRYVIDNEHYPSTFLAIRGLLDEVDSYQATYDDWIITISASSPFVFTDLNDEKQIKPLIKAIYGGLYTNPNRYLFGRKFAPDCIMAPLDYLLSYRQFWKKSDL